MEISTDTPAERWRITLAAAGALGVLFLSLALFHAATNPKGTPPDEWAHITYVHEATNSPYLLPDYEDSRILPAAKARNYLKHPPLYYSLLGLAGKVFGQDASKDYRFFRTLSALFVALGLALWVLTARMLGFGLMQSIPLVLSVNALPMFPFLAGSINNDNLAYLSVAVAFLGLASIRRLPRASWYIGAAGLGIGLLTKGTAGLFLALVFGLWGIVTLAGNERGLLANRHFATSLLLLFLTVGGYYVFALIHYGEFLPTSGALYADESPSGDLLGFGGFLWSFFGLMAKHVSMMIHYLPVAPLRAVERGLLFASLLLPVLGFALSKLPGRRRASDTIANIIVAAALLTLGTHVVITWEAYLRLGEIHSTQPRYYFYLVPTFAVFAFVRFRENRPLRFTLWACVALAVLMNLIAPIRTIRAEKLRNAPMQTIPFNAKPASDKQLQRVDLEQGRVGWLGQARRSGDDILIRGWAIEQETAEPATGVAIYYDGREIGSIQPARPRPDVAAALKDDDAQYAGFDARIRGVPPQISPCDLQYAAVQRSGKAIAVPQPDTLCR